MADALSDQVQGFFLVRVGGIRKTLGDAGGFTSDLLCNAQQASRQ
ncbi:hypothetical protein YPPY01_2698 [Yersinia pestis PY-01]|nr:hypothetical protein YPPY01_2698 [Yersinia pestis PY-01]